MTDSKVTPLHLPHPRGFRADRQLHEDNIRRLQDWAIGVRQAANFVPAPGLICFTFDDTWIQQMQVLQYMARNNQRATVYVNKTDLTATFGYNIGHPACMDLDDLVRVNRMGHEIGNHSMSHLDMTALTAAQRATSLDTVNSELVAAGIPQPSTFAYPYGYRSVYTDRDLATRFRTFRYAGVMQFDRDLAGSIFRIGGVRLITAGAALSGLGDVHVTDAMEYVRQCASRPVIYCFFSHLGPPYDGTEATFEEFKTLLDYAKELDVACVSVSEAFGGMNHAPNGNFLGHASEVVGWPFELASGPGSPTVTLATGVTVYDGGEGTQALKLHTGNASDVAYKGFRAAVRPGTRYWLSGRVKMANGPSVPTGYATDTFARSVTDDWGTASGGGAWTRQTGTAADLDVGSGVGTIVTHAGETHYATHPMDGDHPEVDVTVAYTDSATPSGDVLQHSVFLKWVDTTHYLRAAFIAGAFGFGEVRLFFRNGGVETRVDAPTEPWFQADGDITNNSNNYFPDVPENDTDKRWLRVQCVDEWPSAGKTTVRMKWWLNSAEAEPAFWQYVYVDDTFSGTSGKIGLGNVGGAALAANITTSWDDLTVVKPQGTTGNGALLRLFALGANGNTLPDFVYNSPLDTPQVDYNQSTWVQIALDAPFEAPPNCTTVEVRAYLSGISADAHFHHIVLGTERAQPDGPLG